MDRRAFIKLSAITGTSASLASCGNPENHLIRFIPDEELVPGVAEWKPSICPLCQAGCGLQVRVMEADADVTRNGQRGVVKMGVAKKLEGNPVHPISQGALCPRGQAAIQITYHPDRITHPLKRNGARGSGQFQDVTWDEALSALVSRLDALAAGNDQPSLALLTRPRRSQRQALAATFLSRFGAPPPLTFELFGEDVLRRANALSFGREQLPTFDLARSRYVIAFGADFLGTWNSPVSQNAGYGMMRQGHPGVRGKFVQVESRMSQSGASADEWVPIRPGTEGVLALGLAHVILKDRLRPGDAGGTAAALIDGWSGGLSDYAPERVERQTGVPSGKIIRLAHEFAELHPSVAIIGGAPLAHTNGLFQAVAVNALNALTGGVGEPGGVFFTPQPASQPASSARSDRSKMPRAIDTVAADILSGTRSPIQVLLIDDANPVFATPRVWRVREAFEKIPFIVSFGNFLDDTSILADLILPDHSFLESWVDARPESGAMVAVAGVAPPVMRPLHATRATPDVLLEVGRRLHQPLNPPLAWQTFDAMLKEAFAALPAPASGDAWSAAQKQGGWWGEVAPEAAPIAKTAPVRFAEPQFDGAASDYPFHFLPYASQAFLDGSLAHLPWMQELPDPLTSAMWSSWVEINPKTADRLQIAQGDLVEIRSQHGAVRAPALLFPGLAPDVIAMPVGQGHETFTRYASGRGANPVGILAPLADSETGALAWAATRVQIARVGGDSRQLTLFAGEMREHPYGHAR
jgi:anaerobic selenocysteine-containing dehydrogenase